LAQSGAVPGNGDETAATGFISRAKEAIADKLNKVIRNAKRQ